MPDPKYDIAISFLHQDEPLAVELEGRLSPTFTVFVYSKKQEEIAGTDGLETFRDVLRNQSRLVVVLYRDGWGKSKWTRVEEAAITDRFLDEGWQWLLFISLDSKCTPPKWLPESKIRLNFEEYGLEQCLGAIKARVEELGATIHQESALDRAKRIEQANLWKEKRTIMLSSEEGVMLACSEAVKFLDKVEATLSEIESATVNIHINFVRQGSLLVARGRSTSMTVFWGQRYSNSLSNSQMRVGLWRGLVLFPGQSGIYLEDPKEYATHLFEPDLTREFGWCWRCSSGRFLTSDQMAEYSVNLFLQSLEHVP